MRISWDEYFMSMAKLAAMRSGCNSRPTGAVIVKNKRIIATGYNGSLPGYLQCTDKGDSFCYRRLVQPDNNGENKYKECPSIHAEQNAMNQIGSCGGNSLFGTVVYSTLFPCIYCMKNLVSVGIKDFRYELKYESPDKERDEYWESKVIEWGIKTKQVSISKETIRYILFNFSIQTSQRRL